MSSQTFFARPSVRTLGAVIASAILSGVYVRGGWVLGFVALVPWLWSLDANRSIKATLLSGYAMSLAYTAGAFAWFGTAMGSYTEVGATVGVTVLLLLAPFFQPQFLTFALVRRIALNRTHPVLATLAAAAAWVATEKFAPRVFDDTLGYALYPSKLLRQAADIGGAPGLTVLLLLSNESFAHSFARRSYGVREIAKPLAFALVAPLLLTIYGLVTLSTKPEAPAPSLRIGLIQSNIVHYEQERKEIGAYGVVRKVLDTHFAMTREAVTKHNVDAVLWSETVYPTTYNHPKSESGAELDREIQNMVNQTGVPLVFGTYDLDEQGEYNAAAFVEPGRGLLGFYRKTRLFPLTEYVPTWMDGSVFRSLLPWTGSWKPGNGAKVFPLRVADGREIPVLTSICLDDVDSDLVIDGARLGAQIALTMSNDSWFTDYRLGAEMHQLVAAFRSIETRLPQFRVTSNGYSSVIDETGTILSGTNMGEPSLLVADLPVRTPPRTLMVLWGDWVGRAGAVFLLGLCAMAIGGKLNERREKKAVRSTVAAPPVLLPSGVRIASGILFVFARASLLFLGGAILAESFLNQPLLQSTLARVRFFALCTLLPEAIAWCLLYFFHGLASLQNGILWILLSGPSAFPETYSQIRAAIPRGKLDHPFFKVVLLSFLVAIPAFLLHQNIAYGSALGEFITYGLRAYLFGFAIWWASWGIGVALFAAALCVIVETLTIFMISVRATYAIQMRGTLETIARVLLYAGLPVWVLFRIFSA